MADNSSKDILSKKMTYNEFLAFMDRYNRDIKKREKKENFKNPYKYKRVFNKDK